MLAAGCLVGVAIFGKLLRSGNLREQRSNYNLISSATSTFDDAQANFAAQSKRSRVLIPTRHPEPIRPAAPSLVPSAPKSDVVEKNGPHRKSATRPFNPALNSPAGREPRAPYPAVNVMPIKPLQATDHEDVRTTALLKGGNVSKKLVVFAHLHGCSGKRICDWTRQLFDNYEKTGVRLDGLQMQTSACNQIDPDPPENWLRLKMDSCKSMWDFCKGFGGSNWMFVETALDVRPPCPGMAFGIVLREPWSRLESTQGKLGWTFPNASDVIKRMKLGDDPLDDATGWNYCKFRHAPTCQPFFKAGYFNNYYIRFLLGMKEGATIPWNMVREEHFEKAKRILEDFDLVIPIDNLADALPGLQCAVGPSYDVGFNGKPGGLYKWTTERKKTNWVSSECQEPARNWHEQTKQELCKFVRQYSHWDRKLYEWALERWRGKTAGRCHHG